MISKPICANTHVEVSEAQYQLTELVDLLKRCQITRQGSGSPWVWCNDDHWEVVDGEADLYSPDLYLYSGPSLTEALKKLLEEAT